jgi:hypothetical protein
MISNSFIIEDPIYHAFVTFRIEACKRMHTGAFKGFIIGGARVSLSLAQLMLSAS